MSQPDVVIVGAGLAGLSCAAYLHRAGLSVSVLEASDGVGGRVRSDRVDGFTLDRGFQVVLTDYPELKSQFDLKALDIKTFEPGASVRINGSEHVIGDPLRKPLTLASTLTAPVGGFADKLRIAALRLKVQSRSAPRLLRGKDISTAEALRKMHFSGEFVESFFRPLAGGIQLDPELSASRRMFDVVFRSLARGRAGVPADGMRAIPEQLLAQLPPGMVEINSKVTSVNNGHVHTVDGRSLKPKHIVVATEGPAASALLGLPTVDSKCVTGVYFAAPNAPVKHKYIILDADRSGPALNVAVMSNVAPSYAPEGKHLIVAAVPGSTDTNLEEAVRTQLRGWWGHQVDSWRFLRSYRIPHGQPDQTPPFSPKKNIRLQDGLWVCGDHRDTASIQGALYSGRRCAHAIINA